MQFRRGWLVLLLACFAIATGAVGWGYTVAELEGIVEHEAIPEISTAAGIALGAEYATKTEAELRDLAVEGRTIGIRTAAAAGLTIQFRETMMKEVAAAGAELAKAADAAAVNAALNAVADKLLAIAGGADPEIIRAAAIDPLSEILGMSPKTAAELKALASDSTVTHEVRLAAAKAYYFKSKANVKVVKLAPLEAAVVTSDSAELAYAAGEILAGFYLSFAPKTEAELKELAINGTTEGQRVAGGHALASFLVAKSVSELEVALVELMGWGSVEYRDAYIQALASLYAL